VSEPDQEMLVRKRIDTALNGGVLHGPDVITT
jgi:hypothetical protein